MMGGVAIVPLGWIISHKLMIASFGLMAIGAPLFYTGRVVRREEEIAKEASGGGKPGSEMPGDIHNYSGWRSGGRTETLESSAEGGGGGE